MNGRKAKDLRRRAEQARDRAAAAEPTRDQEKLELATRRAYRRAKKAVIRGELR
jgi:hypothetical protein